MKLNRRTLLKAVGLGALASTLGRQGRGFAQASAPPQRVVFFIQPHGHVPKSWNMSIAGAASDRIVTRSFGALARDELSEALRPLHAFRDKLLVIEGLSHSTVLSDIAKIKAEKTGDLNNHSVAVAGLLTGVRAQQSSGVPCTGGGRSFDQELALRTAGVGRFGSRVYGTSYVPNATAAPFSFLGPGQATPTVADPSTAFADLMGYYVPPAQAEPTREELLRVLRGSVLDSVADEYAALAPKLGAEGKRKLSEHRDLVRDLQHSLGAGASVAAACDFKLDSGEHTVRQFMQLIQLALACDLTRVVTYVAPVPEAPEFGYPSSARVHGEYAHASVEGNTSCGQTYTPLAERAMTDLSVWYAEHFAYLLKSLDAVPEGNGSMLDHTFVVWLTELGTPTHQHHDVFSLVAGGSFFRTGQYVRYPRELANPIKDFPKTGPSQTRLFTSLLRAMGQSDDVFGIAEAVGAGGEALSFKGPLSELHR